jgi:uncharacterized membrane protein YkvA (DUF1232 family)
MFNKFIEKLKIMINKLKLKAKKLKKEIGALYLAAKRRDLPWYTKLVIILVVAYAVSPIDLIPDFIPVVGYLDDLILLPMGIALAIKLIPRDIMNECREASENIFKEGSPNKWFVGAIIILIWVIILAFTIFSFTK